MWNVKATVVTILVCALGTVSEEIENHLKSHWNTHCYKLLTGGSIAPLLGTAFILRRVFGIRNLRKGNFQMSRHFSHHVVVMLYKNNNNNNSNSSN